MTKQLVVKGAKPFKILEVRCENDAFHFRTSDESKIVHLVPVTFEASSAGKIAQQIEIVTDLGDRKTVTLSAIGQVTEPLAGN